MAVQKAGLQPHYSLLQCLPVHSLLHRCRFPLKSTSDLARGVGLVCLEALESNQGGGQGRVNLNVLRRSHQTHHSGFC